MSSPQGRFVADAALVDGATLRGIEAYGKHLFYDWSTGHVGHVHLGLFGKFRVHRGADVPPPVGEVRMRLHVAAAGTEPAPLDADRSDADSGDAERCDGVTIDLAGPTACSIGTRQDRDAIVARLGPDPLRRDADPHAAIARMARSKQPLGALLLDQSVLSGVGNVYRAEALFITGIDPRRPGNACDPAELRAVWDTVVAMLRKGVKDNRIVTVDRREVAVPRGRVRRGEATYVYHRDRCLRCASVIQTVDLAGRACYFCPTCQPR